VRNKFFAHKALSDEDAAVLFTMGSNRQLQQLYAFLGSSMKPSGNSSSMGENPCFGPRAIP